MKKVVVFSLIALAIMLIALSFREGRKTVNSDKSALAFAKWQLQEFCQWQEIDCNKFDEGVIESSDLDKEPDNKYKWWIIFTDKDNSDQQVYFVISEWGEREISDSLEKLDE